MHLADEFRDPTRRITSAAVIPSYTVRSLPTNQSRCLGTVARGVENSATPTITMAENFAVLREWRSSGALPSERPRASVNDVSLLTEIQQLLITGCEGRP
jgi:hypothetical protein